MPTPKILEIVRAGTLAVALMASTGSPVHAACDCTTLPTLGRALNWPALGIGNILVELQGATFADSSTVAGNVGVTGAMGIVHVQGNAGVAGEVGHTPGATVYCTPAGTCPAKILGGVVAQDMSGPAADAIAASAAFQALTTTQSYGSITGNTAISGNGCINVISINGDIDLNGNKKIRLSGTADDYFVINVTGNIVTDGTADIVLDGLDPSHVIFNLVTPGAVVELGGDSGGDFTILNPAGSIYLHGNAGGRGAYYAGMTHLIFQGNTDFFGEPFECGNTSCPDPELTGANIQTPATPQGRGLGNTSFFYAYFDLTTYEGHLEHYRLNSVGTIKDESNVDAIDPSTDEFKATRDPYWDAAIPLRTNTSRTIHTTIGGAQVDFDASAVTEADLDLLSGEISSYPNFPGSTVTTLPLLKNAIIDYLHGKDAFQEYGANPSALRPTVLGDIFHSNPLFIGTPTTTLRHETGYDQYYKDYEQRDRVVYAGANDGIFHAFDAGAWYNPDDPAAFDGGTGNELFGYVPGLLLPSVKLVPRTSDASGERLAPSFVDGNIVAADAWVGDGSGTDVTKSANEWATVLMAAFREGGNGYLALDVTDPAATSTDPHYPYPKLLWEFTDVDMGESWSRPVITRVRLAGSSGTGDQCGRFDGDGDCREQWVAIFGAGYTPKGDPNDDAEFEGDPTSLAWTDVSRAIYMVAIDTGQVLAKVEFDATGTNGPSGMLNAIPSQPGVFDLNNDRFADIVLIGDAGGKVWKWDISAKGVDSDADPEIDNWTYGAFFNAAPASVGGSKLHYKSFFYPPSAAYLNGQLIYVFATGERKDLLFIGDAAYDENNRIYVIRDPNPIGASSIPASPYTEADLTNATATAIDGDPTDLGYYLVAPDGEKFITDLLIFSGHAILASYNPDSYPACGPGEAFLYTFNLANGLGYYDGNATPEASDRRYSIGTGIPSTPRISVSPNPTNDIGFINTSDKKVLTFDPPDRDPPESSVLYWRQRF